VADHRSRRRKSPSHRRAASPTGRVDDMLDQKASPITGHSVLAMPERSRRREMASRHQQAEHDQAATVGNITDQSSSQQDGRRTRGHPGGASEVGWTALTCLQQVSYYAMHLDGERMSVHVSEIAGKNHTLQVVSKP